MLEELHSIKEQLFDAPSEVKEAFNTVVGYFDTEYFGKGKGKSSSSNEEGRLIDKFMKDGYLSVNEMSRLEKLQGDGYEGSIAQARKSKIPNFESMIVLDMEEGPGAQILNGPIHEKSKLTRNIWNNGRKAPAAVWINQFTTEDGIVYYEVMDTFYGQYVCNRNDLSKLLKGAPKIIGKGKR